MATATSGTSGTDVQKKTMEGNRRKVTASRDSKTHEDAWYYEMIEQYRESNPELYKRLLQNPYLVSVVGKYNSSIGDDIIENLTGKTTSADRFYQQLRMDAQNWMNNVLSEQHQEDYTSEIAQVARQRSAGINTDLAGTLGSGDPADFQNPDTDTNIPQGDTNDQFFNLLDSVGKGVINAITTTMGLAQNIQGLMAGAEGIVANEFENISTANNWLLQQIAQNMPDSFFDKDYKNTDDFETGLVQQLLTSLDLVRNSQNFNKLSRQARKYVGYSIDSFKNGGKLGMKTLYQELYNKYLKSKQETVNIRGQHGYSDDIDEWIKNIEPHLKKYWDAEEANWEKAVAEKEGVELDNEFKRHRKEKIDSLDTLFKAIEDAIPNDAKWKPFGVMLTRLVKMGLVQKFFSE